MKNANCRAPCCAVFFSLLLLLFFLVPVLSQHHNLKTPSIYAFPCETPSYKLKQNNNNDSSYNIKTDLQVCIFSIFLSVWKLSKAHHCAVLLQSPQLSMQKEQQMMSCNPMRYNRCVKLVMRFDSTGRCKAVKGRLTLLSS